MDFSFSAICAKWHFEKHWIKIKLYSNVKFQRKCTFFIEYISILKRYAFFTHFLQKIGLMRKLIEKGTVFFSNSILCYSLKKLYLISRLKKVHLIILIRKFFSTFVITWFWFITYELCFYRSFQWSLHRSSCVN